MLKKAGLALLCTGLIITVLFYVLPGANDSANIQTKDHQQRQMMDDRTKTTPPITDTSTASAAITQTVNNMTLDEKIGQMIIAGLPGTTLDDQTRKLITTYQIGGFIFYSDNLVTAEQSVQLLNDVKTANRANPNPLFLSVDQEGGSVSRLPGDVAELPGNAVIGAVNEAPFSYEVGTLLGKMVKAYGFNMNYAPVLDVNSNPDNPVIGDRAFSSNPEIVGKLGTETMTGMQDTGVIPVVKHFPGHGDTSVDSHYNLPAINKTKAELAELELIPFKQAIENNADVVMVAHILLSAIDDRYPASMSEKVITTMLRDRLEFTGVVITDDMTMQAITNTYSLDQAAVQAIKAGTDIIMVAHGYEPIPAIITEVKAAVEKGTLTEKRINASVTRILELKDTYHIRDEQTGAVQTGQLDQLIDQTLQAYIP